MRVLDLQRLALVAVLTVVTASSVPVGAVIYGEDDRRQPFGVSDPVLLGLADSTAIMIDLRDGFLDPVPSGYDIVGASSFGTLYGLCVDEAYWNEPSIGYCSAFFVGQIQRHLIASGYRPSLTLTLTRSLRNRESGYVGEYPSGTVNSTAFAGYGDDSHAARNGGAAGQEQEDEGDSKGFHWHCSAS